MSIECLTYNARLYTDGFGLSLFADESASLSKAAVIFFTLYVTYVHIHCVCLHSLLACLSV